jgi:hypothetical protein
MAAVELTGTIDEHHQLRLDSLPPVAGPMRVRVLVLYPVDDEWDEAEWLRYAAGSPAFDALRDAAEDIYTLDDGKPMNHEA